MKSLSCRLRRAHRDRRLRCGRARHESTSRSSEAFAHDRRAQLSRQSNPSASHTTEIRRSSPARPSSCLRQLGEPVGLGQRGDDARALLRMLHRLDRCRRRRRAARRAHIRAGPSSSCRRNASRTGSAVSGSGCAPASRSSSGRTTRAKVTKAATGLPGRPTKAAPSPRSRRGSRPSPPAGRA